MGCLWGRKKSKILVTLKDANTKYALPLIQKEVITKDTRRLRFALPSSEHILGLPVGKHVQLSATIENELVMRSYTPITSDEEKGYFDLVIKVYFKNQNPNFPKGGKMSQYLDNLKIGDKIDVQGPTGRLEYSGLGTLLVKKIKSDPPVVVKARRINLICGGTGITPMMQIIRAICKNPLDNTELRLLYANHTEADIILRDELIKFAEEHFEQLQVWFTISKDIPEGWKYSTGRINEEIMHDNTFPAADDVISFICGPPAMVNLACVPNLKKLGHNENSWFIC